jgi:methylated-DNA-[protein]-cysteine S-methyltransferase
MYFTSLETSVGRLWLTANEDYLLSVGWRRPRLAGMTEAPHQAILLRTVQQLNEYFAGTRERFELPLSPRGTEFQLKAWSELQKIPYGETISYGEQAERLGDKNLMRAVGMANGRNPIAIVIPCHRVVAANGIGGFGGGFEAKRILLDLESRQRSLFP